MSPGPTGESKRGAAPAHALLALALCAGCGAKSGLAVDEAERPDAADAGPDARTLDAGGAGRDGGGDTADAGAQPDASDCPPRPLSLGAEAPAVMLVVDRSGSMNRVFRMPTPRYPEPATRFELVLENLVGPPRGLVGTYEDRVRFGAMTFAATSTRCPDLRFVLPALGAREAVRDTLLAAPVSGSTPLAETIAETVALLAEEPDGPGGRPVLVLTTDGEPTGCERGPARDAAEEVRRAFDAGLRTLVVSVGDEVGEAFLAEIADIGAGLPPGSGTRFFRGTNWVDLGPAIEGAVGAAIACRAELPVDALDVPCEALPLELDGRPLRCGDPDGFRQAGGTTIELLGEACDQVQTRVPPPRLVLGSLCDP